MTGAAPPTVGFRARVKPQPGARVLVLYAHPVPHRSRVNAALADVARSTPGVTFHDLYETWPDFAIDVSFEQELLLAHQAIVFQHPMYWYSTPALLKEWQDLVLEHGWAYGRGGDKLKGKILLSAISTGGPEVAYQGRDGRATVRDLFQPIAQTARLCGMSYPPPFVVHGSHRLDDAGIAAAARDYGRVLAALRDGRLDPDAARPDGSLDVARALGPGEGVH